MADNIERIIQFVDPSKFQTIVAQSLQAVPFASEIIQPHNLLRGTDSYLGCNQQIDRRESPRRVFGHGVRLLNRRVDFVDLRTIFHGRDPLP